MKTKLFLQGCSGLLILSALLLSCIPDNLKEQMNDNMQMAQSMFADQEFKKAIAHIELHKLRNGSYPSSLQDLKFLTVLDSSTLKFIEYHKLDSGYELNINFEFPSLTSNKQTSAKLSYPEEFWKGLGCVKSNAK